MSQREDAQNAINDLNRNKRLLKMLGGPIKVRIDRIYLLIIISIIVELTHSYPFSFFCLACLGTWQRIEVA